MPMIRVLLILLGLALLPAVAVLTTLGQGGVLALLQAGEFSAPGALPAFTALAPPVNSLYGYDGQFYAQLALDPALTDPGLAAAIDSLVYRARRIGLPALAWLLGAGQAAWVVPAYALLNMAFWAMLAVCLLRHVHWQLNPRSLALLIASLWTAGTLVSLERALTDLPAAALGVLAVTWLAQSRGLPWLLSFAALTKETSALSFLSAWQQRAHAGRLWQLPLILFLPLGLWFLFVLARFGSDGASGSGTFAWPGESLLAKLQLEIPALIGQLAALTHPWQIPRLLPRLLETLAVLSIAVQSLFLLSHWRWKDPVWGLGVGFAALFWVLGPGVLAEYQAYTRVLLPLTLAFNLLLWARGRQSDWLWWVLGNLGLGIAACHALIRLLPGAGG